jgi:hypothetical protein
MKVRILVGANAYACITDGNCSVDVLLSPGKGPAASLRETAAETRERARRDLVRADRYERAADQLERETAAAREIAREG